MCSAPFSHSPRYSSRKYPFPFLFLLLLLLCGFLLPSQSPLPPPLLCGFFFSAATDADADLLFLSLLEHEELPTITAVVSFRSDLKWRSDPMTLGSEVAKETHLCSRSRNYLKTSSCPLEPLLSPLAMNALVTKAPARGKALVLTDLSISIPEGTYAHVAPRSGLAWKHTIDVGARVIDADYCGSLGVILFNFSDVNFEVKAGDRIAQLIIERIMTPDVVEVEDLDSTARGARGFGSTGV